MDIPKVKVPSLHWKDILISGGVLLVLFVAIRILATGWMFSHPASIGEWALFLVLSTSVLALIFLKFLPLITRPRFYPEDIWLYVIEITKKCFQYGIQLPINVDAEHKRVTFLAPIRFGMLSRETFILMFRDMSDPDQPGIWRAIHYNARYKAIISDVHGEAFHLTPKEAINGLIELSGSLRSGEIPQTVVTPNTIVEKEVIGKSAASDEEEDDEEAAGAAS